ARQAGGEREAVEGGTVRRHGAAAYGHRWRGGRHVGDAGVRGSGIRRAVRGCGDLMPAAARCGRACRAGAILPGARGVAAGTCAPAAAATPATAPLAFATGARGV